MSNDKFNKLDNSYISRIPAILSLEGMLSITANASKIVVRKSAGAFIVKMKNIKFFTSLLCVST